MNSRVLLFYSSLIVIIHVVYFLVFFGLLISVPKGILYLNVFTQLFLCLVLIVRFRPYKPSYELSSSDHMFIFGSAILLFTNVVFVELIKIPFVNNIIKKIIPSNLNNLIQPNTTTTTPTTTPATTTTTNPNTSSTTTTTTNNIL